MTNRMVCSAAAMAAILLTAPIAKAQPASSCTPKVEGPITITADSKPYDRVDLPDAGAVEEEFFVSCTVSAGAYKTLVHVRLPKASVAQSGIVVAEPWHPGNIWSLYAKVSEYEARAGHVHVVIVGSPMVLDSFVKKADPKRYASLSLPKGTPVAAGTSTYDSTEFEVLAQVGRLIKAGGLPGIKPRKVILGGMSQTGGVVRAYIGYEHKGAAKSVYDGYFPEQSAATSYIAPIADLDVPVVELQGERELIVVRERGADHITYRRPDGPLYRLYEVPGMPHVATRGRGEGGGSRCTGHTVSDFPTFYVYGATLDNLIAWVDKGVPAPHVPLIETDASGATIKRDAASNALGGYRTSYVDVPTATYHSTWASYVTTAAGPSDADAARCDKMGWVEKLPAGQLQQLYPSHAAYVAKVEDSLKKLVAARLILPDDAKVLADEARAAPIP